jgi:hypothetical protein
MITPGFLASDFFMICLLLFFWDLCLCFIMMNYLFSFPMLGNVSCRRVFSSGLPP